MLLRHSFLRMLLRDIFIFSSSDALYRLHLFFWGIILRDFISSSYSRYWEIKTNVQSWKWVTVDILKTLSGFKQFLSTCHDVDLSMPGHLVTSSKYREVAHGLGHIWFTSPNNCNNIATVVFALKTVYNTIVSMTTEETTLWLQLINIMITIATLMTGSAYSISFSLKCILRFISL